MTEESIYVDVLLPINIPQPLTYSLPSHLAEKARLGCRVLVKLGSTKYCSAIIIKLHNDLPTLFTVKPVEDILDETPIFDTDKQLYFFHWVAKYYMATIGEIVQCGLPSVLKISSETIISIHPEFDGDVSEISKDEHEIVDFILKSIQDVKLSELKKTFQNIFKILQSLYSKAIIVLYEEAKDKHIPKLKKFIYLNSLYLEKENAQKLYNELEKKPKQLDVILFFHSNAEKDGEGNLRLSLDKFDFETLSKSSLKTLLDKSILHKKLIKVSRFPQYNHDLSTLPSLSDCQAEAFKRTLECMNENRITLFYGSHYSGKSIIQLHILSEIIQKKQQILYLVPEIAMSEYLVNQLKKYFGDVVLAYNSKYSDQERNEVWQKVIKGDPAIVVAVRNGIFLPFKNLGMVMIDSEHDESYKQNERSPRYNARDSAMILAKTHSAPLVMFSATPSIESFYNANEGKFGFVMLKRIYNNISKKKIILKNFTQAAREQRVKDEFTLDLIEEIQNRLSRGEKVLIFQSKKGYAPYVSCKECAAVPSCVNCNVSLTYHQYYSSLKCHYCGYRQSMIDRCRECGSSVIKNIGFGTEKLEETLRGIFPGKNILRFDPETTKSKKAMVELISQIDSDDIDILLGTQILTKGFNFINVSLAAIMQIDHILNSQDFRAHERTFQTISLVCSKAIFGENPIGFVQTNNTKHFILRCGAENDYSAFYENEIRLRQKNFYPPFSNIIKISFFHKLQLYVDHSSNFLYQSLLPYAKEVVISTPVAPIVNRIRNEYILDIWIKLPKNSPKSQAQYKQIILEKIDSCKKIDKKFRSTKIVVDVDV